MESADSLIVLLENGRSNPSKSFLLNLFKELRKSKVNRPDIIIKYGPTLLNGISDNELWPVVEQIFLAAVDTGNVEAAENMLYMLVKQFPKSGRVNRLRGMMMELTGDYTQALFIYNEVLKEQPGNMLVMKRKVAVYRSTASTPELINELLTIVKHFPFDTQTWAELASLYLQLGSLEEAIHCYEELILIEPLNPHYHSRLAEAYYTQGDYDHLLLARKHYSTSLTMLAPEVNLRALYGLLYACRAISSDTTADGHMKRSRVGADGVSDTAVNDELLSWAKDSMEVIHESTGKDKVQLHSYLFTSVY